MFSRLEANLFPLNWFFTRHQLRLRRSTDFITSEGDFETERAPCVRRESMVSNKSSEGSAVRSGFVNIRVSLAPRSRAGRRPLTSQSSWYCYDGLRESGRAPAGAVCCWYCSWREGILRDRLVSADSDALMQPVLASANDLRLFVVRGGAAQSETHGNRFVLVRNFGVMVTE